MNSVTILGTVYGKVTYGKTPKETPTANFVLRWKKPRGEGHNYLPITLYGRENMHPYITEGKNFAVHGRIETGSYEKDGSTVYTKKLVLDRIEFEQDGEINGLSNVVITGNLFADAVISAIPNDKQTAVAECRVAVKRPHDKDNCDSVPVKMYGKRVELEARHLVKGAHVSFVGFIETFSYKNSKGEKVYSWRTVQTSDENMGHEVFEKVKEGMVSTEAPTAPEAPIPEEPSAEEAAVTEGTDFAELPEGIDDGYFGQDF